MKNGRRNLRNKIKKWKEGRRNYEKEKRNKETNTSCHW
jgi:hypothetical protein